MIKAICSSSLDKYKTATWPDSFVAVPNIGDNVEGEIGDERPVLQVRSVTHCIGKSEIPYNKPEPYIRIELS